MKKVFKTLGMVAMSATILVSCVENEESEGVKNLRTAQAALINANAEEALARAQKTVAEIQLVVEDVNGKKIANTGAAYRAQHDSLNILIKKAEVALKTATTEKEVASLKADIADKQRAQELAILQQEANILDVQKALETAKVELQKAVTATAKAMAEATVESEKIKSTTLNDYLVEYKKLVGFITVLQNDIALTESTIATTALGTEQYRDIVIASKQRAIKDEELAIKSEQVNYNNLVNLQTAYKAAVADPSTAASRLVTVETELKQVEVAITEKTIEVNASKVAYDAAEKVKDDANDQTVFVNTKINALLSNSLFVTNITDPITKRGLEYYSLYYYEYNIADLNEKIRTATVAILESNKTISISTTQKTELEAALPTLKSNYETASADYNAKKLDYEKKYQEYLAAQAALDADPTSTTKKEARDTALTNYSLAYTAYSKADTAYTNAKNKYTNAIASIETYANAIATANYEINKNNKVIEDANAKITLYTTNKANATTELANLKASLSTVQAAEKTAIEAFYAASYENSVDAKELTVLETHKANLVTLQTNLKSISSGITTTTNNFEKDIKTSSDKIAVDNEDIAKLKIQIADAEAGKVLDAAQEQKLKDQVAQWKSELTAYQTDLARYAALISGLSK